MNKFVVCLLLAGCGGGGADHWSKRPIETISPTVNGWSFTMDVVKGMHMKETSLGLEFDLRENDRVYTPNITVWITDASAGGAKPKLDTYLAQEKPGEILRKDDLPDGFIVTAENPNYPGKNDYLIESERLVGAKVVRCGARVTRFSKGDTVKEHLPLVEKMCLSIKAR